MGTHQLDDVFINSVQKKKSKSNLNKSNLVIPEQVVPLPEAFVPAPEFIDMYELEAALHLTKASISVNYTIQKIHYYGDLLSSFDNIRNDRAINLAEHINEKIAKWGAFCDKVEKSMDILAAVTPKKKANSLLDAKIAEGFVSSSGEPPSFTQLETRVFIWFYLLHLIRCLHLCIFSLIKSYWIPPFFTSLFALFSNIVLGCSPLALPSFRHCCGIPTTTVPSHLVCCRQRRLQRR